MPEPLIFAVPSEDVLEFRSLVSRVTDEVATTSKIRLELVPTPASGVGYRLELPWTELIVTGEGIGAALIWVVGRWLKARKKLRVRRGRDRLELENMSEDAAKDLFRKWLSSLQRKD